MVRQELPGVERDKDKELVIGFRSHQGPAAEIVENYKYLGTIIDSKLDWTSNIQASCKKANQHMYFL